MAEVWVFKCPLCRGNCYFHDSDLPDTGAMNVSVCPNCDVHIDEFGPRVRCRNSAWCLKCFLSDQSNQGEVLRGEFTYVPDYTFQTVDRHDTNDRSSWRSESPNNPFAGGLNVNIPNRSNGLIELTAENSIIFQAPTTHVRGNLHVEGQIIRQSSVDHGPPEDGPFYFLRMLTEHPLADDFVGMCGIFEFVMSLCKTAWPAGELPTLLTSKMCILFRKFLLGNLPTIETCAKYNEILRKFKEFISPPKYKEFLQDFIVMSTQNFENKYAN